MVLKPGGADGVGVFVARDWKLLASCLRALCWFLLTGASGPAGEGFWRAWIRSFAAAVAALVDDAVGITTLVGNQMTVSVIHSAVVSRIHMR
jgi:hypothetical protein